MLSVARFNRDPQPCSQRFGQLTIKVVDSATFEALPKASEAETLYQGSFRLTDQFQDETCRVEGITKTLAGGVTYKGLSTVFQLMPNFMVHHLGTHILPALSAQITRMQKTLPSVSVFSVRRLLGALSKRTESSPVAFLIGGQDCTVGRYQETYSHAFIDVSWALKNSFEKMGIPVVAFLESSWRRPVDIQYQPEEEAWYIHHHPIASHSPFSQASDLRQIYEEILLPPGIQVEIQGRPVLTPEINLAQDGFAHLREALIRVGKMMEQIEKGFAEKHAPPVSTRARLRIARPQQDEDAK